MKSLTKLAMAVSAAALLAGSAQAAEIKVGSAGGVTGPIAELVAAIVKGREVATADINNNGGLLNGTYVYFATDRFPYYPRCLYGTQAKALR